MILILETVSKEYTSELLITISNSTATFTVIKLNVKQTQS